MPTETFLPWQTSQWHALLQRKKQNQWPHALLLSGIEGTGKTRFARQLAHFLLCMKPEENRACGQCQACRLQEAGSHPDFLCVTPEEKSRAIKVDQIREVIDLANGTAMLGGARVILIYPASAMNTHASNALLKTLEEPTTHTFLILVCEEKQRLPATLRSRCQTVIFPRPAREVALSWLHDNVQDMKDISADDLSQALDFAEGAPFAARDFCINGTLALQREVHDGLIQMGMKQLDPVSFAVRLEEKDIGIIFQSVLSFVRDLLRYKLAGFKTAHSDSGEWMMKLTPEALFNMADVVQQAHAHFLNGLNLNRALVLKDIFIRWAMLC